MKKRIYVKGDIVNGLEFIKELPERVQPNGKKKRIAIMRCNCKEQFKTHLYPVINGITKGCKQCAKKRIGIKNSTHGLSKHKLFPLWWDIKRRCYDKKNHAYKYYGLKGIVLYKDWIDDFKSFYDYVTLLPSYYEDKLGTGGITIDRIDNDGSYEPGNIRFTNATIQNFNKGLQINNKTGHRGINKRNNGTYQAKISYNKKVHYIGTFKDIESAVIARNKYVIKNKIPIKYID